MAFTSFTDLNQARQRYQAALGRYEEICAAASRELAQAFHAYEDVREQLLVQLEQEQSRGLRFDERAFELQLLAERNRYPQPRKEPQSERAGKSCARKSS